MDNMTLAQRYAEAIFEIAQKKGKVFDVLEMLTVLLERQKRDNDLKKFMELPVINKEDKKELINKIYHDIDEDSLEILDYLIDKDRMYLINQILNEYTKIYHEAHNKLIVTAIFPKELNSDQKEKLENKLIKKTGKNVIVYYQVDPSLIGGGIVRINDNVIDGSIRSQLDKLKN